MKGGYRIVFALVFLGITAGGCSCDDESDSPNIAGSDTGVGVDSGEVDTGVIDDSGQPIVTDTAVADTAVEEDTAMPDTSPEDTDLEDVADTSEPWPWDHPEPECGSDDDCADGARCFGGACVEPQGAESFSEMGVVVEFSVPPSGGDEVCCFDLDGDDEVDNTMAVLLDTYEEALGVDVRAQLNQQLNEQRQHLMFQALRDMDTSQLELGMFVGWSDVNSDGVSDTTPAQREAGEGTFLIDPRSVGDFGPLVGFPKTTYTVEDDITRFQTTEAQFTLGLPAGRPCSWVWHTAEPLSDYARCRNEQPLPLSFSRLRAEGALRYNEAGVSTVAEEGAIRMGGYVHLDALKDLLNADYGDNCQCIGLEREQDIFISEVEDGRYTIRCAEPFGESLDLSECSEFNRACPGIADLCAQLPLLSGLAEYDSDGDGANDSVSIGLQVTIAAAQIPAEDNLRPPLELCGDAEADADGDSLAGCEDPGCWDDVNCGHEGWGEQCRDGIDNDGDDIIDCEDPQCNDNLACIEDP